MQTFPTAPHHLADTFRRHVADTGRPETFPGICNDRPPADGEVVALTTGIVVDRRKRPEKDEAPCPICSRGKPKWLNDGSLIWCAATEAIYAIGPDCYRTIWSDGRLDVALNLLRRTQREHDNALKLALAVEAAGANLAWLRSHLALASRVDNLHRAIAEATPTFRRSVSRQLRSGIATPVRGLTFLRGSWRLEARLREAEKEILHLQTRASGKDVKAWAADLAPRIVEERLQDFRRARREMETVAQGLSEASAFLDPKNIQALAVWSRSATIPFTARHTAGNVEIRCEAEYWRGPLGIPAPSPLPG